MGTSLRNFLLLIFSKGTLVFAAFVMPAPMDTGAWALVAAVLAWQLGLQFGLGTALMRHLGQLSPAPPEIESMTRKIGTDLNVSVRRVWRIGWLQANAVAFVTTRDIGYTDKLLGICTDAELAAICAHECGHLRESRWLVSLRVIQSLALTPIIFVQPMHRNLGAPGLLLLLYLCLGIFLLQRLYSQNLERRADAVATAHTTDPLVYAQALEKIHRANLHPAVIGKDNSSHPNL